jgi:TonB family protein
MRFSILLVVLSVAAAAVPADAQQRAERPERAQKAGADTTGVYELRAVEELPRPIDVAAFQRALATTYPPELRDAGRSGEVTVRFIVEPDGKVSHASVVRSSDKAFDAPTLAAVRTLRFRPAKVGGRPARVWVMQPVQWMVADDGEESGGSGRP